MVYIAEQTEAVERRVTLETIHPGMDPRHVIARLEAERQTLVTMNHPGIAHAIDDGTTDSGRPSFAMALRKVVPIARNCDEHLLTLRQRLDLSVAVCHAVQHGHQTGINHRDINPSNVLVAEYDDRAAPKTIDFGVVEAIEQRLAEQTKLTQMARWLARWSI